MTTTKIDASIFKSYDIRGIAGQTLTEPIVMAIGQAIGSEAKARHQNHLVVGRDGRHSSPKLSEALIKGITKSGVNVINIGMVPTPVLYFACHHLVTQSGVMVTGSHNPADYNGLKIVIAGKSLADSEIQAIYQRIECNDLETGQGIVSVIDVVKDYITRITADVTVAKKVKVVVDCGNGAAGLIAPQLLTKIGCKIMPLYCDVDGSFPNHHPDPSQPENLRDLALQVQQHHADLGFAFDGDGDRLGVVDAEGKIIWPDRLMMLFAKDLLSRHPGETVIYDVKSTNLLADAIKKSGGTALMCKTGHSVIKNKMQETGAKLAGEMSGHIFFKERWFGFDDGLYAACRLLEIVSCDALGRTPTEVLTAIANSGVNTPEIIVNMREGSHHAFMTKLSAVATFEGATKITIDGVRAEYPHGWGLVRASNTLPALTLRFEADSADSLQDIQKRFKRCMLQVKPDLAIPF